MLLQRIEVQHYAVKHFCAQRVAILFRLQLRKVVGIAEKSAFHKHSRAWTFPADVKITRQRLVPVSRKIVEYRLQTFGKFLPLDASLLKKHLRTAS